MSNKVINSGKRDQMRRYTTQLMVAKGWTVAQLGAVFGVSESTIRSWKAGKSMGTNEQRAQLGRLLTSNNVGPFLRERVMALLADINHAEAVLNRAPSDDARLAANRKWLAIVREMADATTLKNG